MPNFVSSNQRKTQNVPLFIYNHNNTYYSRNAYHIFIFSYITAEKKEIVFNFAEKTLRFCKEYIIFAER